MPNSPAMNIALMSSCVKPRCVWNNGAYREYKRIDPALKLCDNQHPTDRSCGVPIQQGTSKCNGAEDSSSPVEFMRMQESRVGLEDEVQRHRSCPVLGSTSVVIDQQRIGRASFGMARQCGGFKYCNCECNQCADDCRLSREMRLCDNRTAWSKQESNGYLHA